jgi:ubiquinone/menaquinone biosynthesis C-methylase UbiE
MISVSSSPERIDTRDWVRETRFGQWFVSTDIWIRYVLQVAIADFRALLGPRAPTQAVVLDAGCGIGLSFPLLAQWLQPRQIIGADIDLLALQEAAQTQPGAAVELKLLHASALQLPLPDNSVDLVYCHQLLHHVKGQEAVLKELLRVLRPGGILLSGESCRSFIHSLWVRLLFRHPDMVQKTAQQYVDLIRAAGFELADADVSKTVPWWSRVDFGLLQRWGLSNWRPDFTEVNAVAFKAKPL